MVVCDEETYHGNYTGYDSKNSTFTAKVVYLPLEYILLAFIAALIATVIALFNIYKHVSNYTRPEFQKLLIRIIFIVPVYACSCLSLAFPQYSLVVESIRDCWEAVVIYEFLRLILAYCGGESSCILVIMKKPGSISHLWPFNYCFPRLQLNAKFMRICKRFTLQFVFVKPIMAAINIAMFYTCNIKNSTYQMTQLIVYNLSYSFSLYGLLLFYFATHHHPGLASRKPIVKFLGIKLIIFATYYQGLAVQLIPGFDRHYLEALNNFIFCWEMIFFAILHVWAFGWFEFVGGKIGIGDPENPLGIDANQYGHSLALSAQDYEIPADPTSKTVQGNITHALDMGDVVSDALENFNTKYDTHVRLDTTSNNPEGNIGLDDDDDDNAAHHPFAALSTPIVQDEQPKQTQPDQTKSNPFKNNPFDNDDLI